MTIETTQEFTSEAQEDAQGLDRRALLVSAAAGLLLLAPGVPTAVASPPSAVEGKAGDFDFLSGSWKIRHRRLKGGDSKDWDEFPGEATCWSVLGGVGSIEELRIPARNFSGLGIRLLDVEQKIWNDYWVNARSGVLATPGLTGSFRDGVGTFTATEVENGKTTIARGVWDRITPKSCRWHQAVSGDGGKTWEENWFMDWTRA
jgi:hypothetical protein